MEVEHVIVRVVDESKVSKESFAQELAKGHFWYELESKKQELATYQDALNSMNKDSFNHEYTEVIIDNLKAEIKKMKKQHSN